MNEFRRDLLLSELDEVIVHLGQCGANIAAQEKRLAALRQRGDDTVRSEALLVTFCECRRLHQSCYDTLLEALNGFD